MSMKKISEAILGVGVDDPTIDLFESQYPVPTGVSYNSYVILDERPPFWTRWTPALPSLGWKTLPRHWAAASPPIW